MMLPDGSDFDPIAEILLAAQFPEPEGELGSADFLLLHRGALSGVLQPEPFAVVVSNLCAGRPLVFASRDRFDRVMDFLFGFGFRDPELPELSPDFLDFLDVARDELAISDEAFSEMLARTPGGATPDYITGEAWGHCLFEMFIKRGMQIPRLPPRTYMDRTAMGQVIAAARGLNLTYPEHMNVVICDGGGCLRTRDLDVRGAQRVLSRYMASGWIAPGAPPQVEPRPGFITQPQANLIWKLSHDIGIPDADGLDEWLEGIAGIEGGLPAVTAAGARYVIDRMLKPVIAVRELRSRQAAERTAKQASEAATVTGYA